MTKDEIKQLALNEFGIPLGAWDANAVPFTATMLCRLIDSVVAQAVESERDVVRKSANEGAAADGPFMDWKSLVSVARSA